MEEGQVLMDATNETLAYYDAHARAFAESTADVDMSGARERFTRCLGRGATILDLGCGSGRDARRFAEAGFVVTATDGSPRLCEVARQLTGIEVRCERFLDLADTDAYDGIWACSSILHLPKRDLAVMFAKMCRALTDEGVIYTSFKYGTSEGMRAGRYFTDFTETTFADFMEGVSGLRLQEFWVSEDVRPERSDERWLNVLLRKR